MNLHTCMIKAEEFKAHCLEIMNNMKRRKTEYIITEKGIPIAKLTPIAGITISPFGYMKNTVISMNDSMKPIDVW